MRSLVTKFYNWMPHNKLPLHPTKLESVYQMISSWSDLQYMSMCSLVLFKYYMTHLAAFKWSNLKSLKYFPNILEIYAITKRVQSEFTLELFIGHWLRLNLSPLATWVSYGLLPSHRHIKPRKYTYSHRTHGIYNHQPNSPQNQTRWSLYEFWNTIVEMLTWVHRWIS
jgi:hypothetical protein